MRLARKLVLLTAMAVAALALSATSASATNAVEVDNAVTDVHCTTCNIHVVGESQISVPGVGPVSTCEDEFTAEVHETGLGHVTGLTNANHASLTCTTQKCNGVGEPVAEQEWPLLIEESAANTATLEVRFCLDVKANPNGTGLHCNADATITEGATHVYNVAMVNQSCAGGARIVNGNWNIEGTPIEIEHS